MIGSILAEFEQTKKPIEDMKRQIKKFMYKRSRTNTKEFHEAIKAGNKIWIDAIDYFTSENLSIDAFAVIVACWSSHADALAKHVNLTQKRIDSFSMINDSERLEAEMDAYRVADYLNQKIKGI
jgi:hypothetical protein